MVISSMKLKSLKDNESGDLIMIIGFFLAIILTFAVVVSYFIISPAYVEFYYQISEQTRTAAGVDDMTDTINRVKWSVDMGHFVVILGVWSFVILLRRVRQELQY